MATLSFYGYDHVGNPWCGGGGALRHREILRRFGPEWTEIIVYVGGYPGFRPHTVGRVRFESLGGGGNEWVSRLRFTLEANLRILRDDADLLGNDVSPYAPLLAGLLRPGRFFGVVHHRIGDRFLDRFGPAGRLPRWIERLLHAGLRRAVTVNPATAEALRRLRPGVRIHPSANGFDPDLLQLDPTPVQPPYLLALGRLDPFMKGLDLLLEAFARLAPRFPELRLVLAGRGTPAAETDLNRRAVAAGIGPRVTVRRDLPEADKHRLLAGCLLFCCPSRFEGFGIAALEAQAAGKPVLASDVDGFRASTDPGCTALLVPPGDAEALADGMQRLLENGELRRRLAEAARLWARRFSWEALAQRESDWLLAEFAPESTTRPWTERAEAAPDARS